jgi:hypothetical protein
MGARTFAFSFATMSVICALTSACSSADPGVSYLVPHASGESASTLEPGPGSSTPDDAGSGWSDPAADASTPKPKPTPTPVPTPTPTPTPAPTDDAGAILPTPDAGSTSVPDAAPPSVCVPGEARCVGDSTETCDATGQWGFATACPYVCSAGVCSGMCTPGSAQCVGNTTETCNASGEWAAVTACPYVCSAGVCTGACTPGAMQCVGNTTETCNAAGEWASTMTCPYVCSGAGECTGSCTPGSSLCSSNESKTCSAAGEWGPATECTYGCSAANTCNPTPPAGVTCSTSVGSYTACDGQAHAYTVEFELNSNVIEDCTQYNVDGYCALGTPCWVVIGTTTYPGSCE